MRESLPAARNDRGLLPRPQVPLGGGGLPAYSKGW